MPKSSSMHTPKLMGEDDVYIKYGHPTDEFDAELKTKKLTEDGVCITMAPYRADGSMRVMECALPKKNFDQLKAAEWISAQKFSLEPADMFRVNGVEIFSTGVWNGKQITDGDLAAIAASYTKASGTVRPFLKLGHDEDQKLLQSDGLPAAGWVENVRKVEGKLLADFVDIPKKIYQLIKNRAYRKVSCEIYNNITIGGLKYSKLLGAVALLGADTPGVMNLNDILSMYCVPRDTSVIEKFAEQSKSDTITTDLKNNGEVSMPELEEYKAQLAESAKQAEDLKAQLEASKAEADKFKSEAAEAQKLVAEAARKTQEAQVEKFVTELQSEKLISKAMAPMVKALVFETTEKYSIESKEYSKADLVKALFEQAKEASKVNFTETTSDSGKTAAGDDVDSADAKILKYAKENKVSYRQAYDVLKIAVPVKSISEVEGEE